MWKRALYLIFMSLVLVVSSFAQGAFLEKGTNGFGMGAAFASNSDITLFGAAVGYSVAGQFDFSISLARGSFSEVDMTVTAISPTIVVHVLKQDRVDFPISVSIAAGYEHDSYSADGLKLQGLKMVGDFFVFGGSLYLDITSSRKMTVQPRVSFAHISGNIKRSDNFGNSESESANTTVFSLATSLVFENSRGSNVVVGPSITFGEDNTTFGIDVGLVVPLPNRKSRRFR